MKDLAGDRDCDRTIARELEQAEIEVVRLEMPCGEVHSRLRGRLGPIAFSRGSGYWSAEGPVPLAVALDLYEDPIGREAVRAQGQGIGGIGPPEAPWVRWYTDKGERVCPVEQQEDFLRMRRQWPQVFATTPPLVFHDDPAAIGAAGYVGLYQIDSEEGLQIFARTLCRHGIHQLVRPDWWERHNPPTKKLSTAPAAATTTNSQTSERTTQWDGDTQEMALDD